MGTIRVKRVYESPSPDDGTRLLVDRLWPRGRKKEDLRLDAWHKDVAPSDELRKWFSHDPNRWPDFVQCYFVELDKNPEVWKPLLKAARAGDITLLYAAKDSERNNAIALQDYLETKLAA